jgi:hypothetical protein
MTLIANLRTATYTSLMSKNGVIREFRYCKVIAEIKKYDFVEVKMSKSNNGYSNESGYHKYIKNFFLTIMKFGSARL